MIVLESESRRRSNSVPWKALIKLIRTLAHVWDGVRRRKADGFQRVISRAA